MCPALGQQICNVCCGTKRLTEIRCPSDCVYLTTAREHPRAAVVRQQKHEVGLLLRFMRDLNERQAQLFFIVLRFLSGYQAPDLQAPVDDDVSEALESLAATHDTAARGLIYEHRPTSFAADRLLTALKPLFVKAGEGGGSSFDRDAAMALRHVREAVRSAHVRDTDERRAFLNLVGRVMRETEQRTRAGEASLPEPRIIVP